jgi:hypothetical protein
VGATYDARSLSVGFVVVDVLGVVGVVGSSTGSSLPLEQDARANRKAAAQ